MYPDKDAWGLYTRDIAPQYQHNFNTSGGTENIRYFVSLGYLDQKGMFAGYDLIPELDYDYRYQRFNYRTNLDFDLTKTTTLQLNLGGRNKITSRPGGSKNDDSVWREIENGSPVSGGGIIDGRLYRKSKYAPDQSSEGFYNNGLRTKRQYELNIDLAVKQKLDYLLKGLSVNVKGSYNSSYDFYFTENELLEEYVPMFRKDMTWLPDDYPVKDPYKVLHVLYNDGAGKKSNTQEYGKGRNFYIEGALNYKQSFGDHTVGVLAMYNAKRTYYPKYFTDLPSGYVGLVGRMTYDYASKYLFDFSIGYNGSENFHKDRRFGTFPSFSLGYVISEEDFWNIDWIPYLKIRGSYGIVGSDKGRDKHARFKYLPGTYVWSGGYNFGDNTNNNWKPGANEGAVSNTLLTWETARKKNIGLDAKFFEGQLEFNFDYFTENRTDILIERNTIPSYVAFTPPTVNLGEVENSGYEFSLNYRKSKGDFRFNAGFNVGFNKNKVIYKDELPLHDAPWAMSTGKAVGQIFGYEFLGFYEEGKLNNNNVDAKEVQPTIQPGDCIYADLNNDGKIDKKDEKSIGHTEYPGITGGINFGIEYKRFSLTSNWAGASKVSRILQGALRRAGGWGHASAILKYSYENRWTPETAATATRPRSSTASQVENTKNSSLWVVDGSYLALKNIQVIYNIPAEPFAKFGITNAS
ncbi:MAG: SusC/RagA family TonB-linked outer membrane protein, partial [Cytophagales bacterium]|nr:SusC/RagA family TonB-linked outer membrane protein [Cytophagales bacterium]